jgi:uncharacterized protein YjbI with pentapeptide repeats
MAELTRAQIEQIIKEAREQGERADLSGANLNRVNLRGADLREVTLIGASLGGAYLSRADLSAADLSEADLSEADLSETNLSETDLRRANLSRADLLEADLSGAYLVDANLSRTYLTKANLAEANLAGADLSETDLKRANLKRANLSKADLSGADLCWANLSEAHLSLTHLIKADLSEADLIQANLGEAYLGQTTLSGAKYNKFTQWSSGFDPIQAGAIIQDVTHVEATITKLKAELDALEISGETISDTTLTTDIARLSGILNLEQLLEIFPDLSTTRNTPSFFTLNSFQKLTPDFLINEVAPYLKTIEDLQHLIDEIQGHARQEVEVTGIWKRSIDISISGVSGAIALIMNTVIPWRREHAKTMAKVAEAKQQAQIEASKTDLLAKRLQLKWTLDEDKEQLVVELAVQREKAEQFRLASEEKRLEINSQKTKLALTMVEAIDPKLDEAEKFDYMTRLLGPLEMLTTTTFEPQLIDREHNAA